MTIYPSILTGSFEEYQRQLAAVLESGVIETVQIDIIDGNFADNLTLTPVDLLGFEYGELNLDLHLMTNEPLNFIFEMLDFKDELPIRGIIAQVERMSSLQAYIEEVKVQEWKVGLSLDLYTPVEAIDENLWPEIDIIQLMTIEAGFQGQKFQEKALEKIAEIKKLAKADIEIMVDGGVKKEILPLLRNSGVDGLTIGSGFWKAVDPVETMREYSQLV